jgi:colanic acid biosynthesis glycosyl transferase WcaI
VRIYIIYRHYWPDSTSYARLLRSIAERFVNDGHDVTVFSAQPSYNDIRSERRPMVENIGGVKVIRMPLLWERKKYLFSRLFNNVLFLVGAFVCGLLSPKMGLVMCPSNPPVVMGVLGRLIAKIRNSKFLYHCQDLHPEVGLLGGKLSEGWFYKFLLGSETATCQGATALVVLSQDMANSLNDRGISNQNVSVLNNFIPERYQEIAEVPDSLKKDPNIFRVLFSGNHGAFQGLDVVIEVAKSLKEYRYIQFQFVGEGSLKDQMIKWAGDMVGQTVFFHDFVSMEVIAKVMEDSDIGLTPLQPKVYKYAYPSKTMMLLAAGLPLLVVVESESELAKFVKEKKIGWTCPPNDSAKMAETILMAYQERKYGGVMKEYIPRVAEECFGISPSLDQWSTLIRELSPDPVQAFASRRSTAL